MAHTCFLDSFPLPHSLFVLYSAMFLPHAIIIHYKGLQSTVTELYYDEVGFVWACTAGQSECRANPRLQACRTFAHFLVRDLQNTVTVNATQPTSSWCQTVLCLGKFWQNNINRPIAHDLNTSDLWHLLVSKKHKPRAISWQSYDFFLVSIVWNNRSAEKGNIKLMFLFPCNVILSWKNCIWH